MLRTLLMAAFTAMLGLSGTGEALPCMTQSEWGSEVYWYASACVLAGEDLAWPGGEQGWAAPLFLSTWSQSNAGFPAPVSYSQGGHAGLAQEYHSPCSWGPCYREGLYVWQYTGVRGLLEPAWMRGADLTLWASLAREEQGGTNTTYAAAGVGEYHHLPGQEYDWSSTWVFAGREQRADGSCTQRAVVATEAAEPATAETSGPCRVHAGRLPAFPVL